LDNLGAGHACVVGVVPAHQQQFLEAARVSVFEQHERRVAVAQPRAEREVPSAALVFPALPLREAVQPLENVADQVERVQVHARNTERPGPPLEVLRAVAAAAIAVPEAAPFRVAAGVVFSD
jgi:hypothetical protein